MTLDLLGQSLYSVTSNMVSQGSVRGWIMLYALDMFHCVVVHHLARVVSNHYVLLLNTKGGDFGKAKIFLVQANLGLRCFNITREN